MADTYWLDGSGVVWFVQDGATPMVGWTPSTLAAYNTWYAAHQAFIAANKAALDAASCAKRKAVYQWHIDAGMPPAIATTVSGFNVGDC